MRGGPHACGTRLPPTARLVRPCLWDAGKVGGKDTNHTNHSAPEALRSPRKTKVAGGWANDEERSEARALKPGRPSCEIKWQLVSGGLRSLYVYTTISKLIIVIATRSTTHATLHAPRLHKPSRSILHAAPAARCTLLAARSTSHHAARPTLHGLKLQPPRCTRFPGCTLRTCYCCARARLCRVVADLHWTTHFVR